MSGIRHHFAIFLGNENVHFRRFCRYNFRTDAFFAQVNLGSIRFIDIHSGEDAQGLESVDSISLSNIDYIYLSLHAFAVDDVESWYKPVKNETGFCAIIWYEKSMLNRLYDI